MKYNEDEVAELIAKGLTKQAFVDWYEKEFVPNYIGESILTQEQVIEQIKKVFNIL